MDLLKSKESSLSSFSHNNSVGESGTGGVLGPCIYNEHMETNPGTRGTADK